MACTWVHSVAETTSEGTMAKAVSRKSIAELAGVSKTTVTRVLSGGSVSEETKKRVMSVISECGYTHNKLAMNVSCNRNSNFVAMLVPDMSNYYYLEVFNSLVGGFEDYDYTISVYLVNKANFNKVLDKVIQNRVSAIINLAFIPFTEAHLKKTRCANIKVIHPGRGEDPVKATVNYRPAMEKAFKGMYDAGVRNFAFICGAGKDFINDRRILGYLDILREHGIENGEETLIWGDYPDISALDAGYIAASALAKSGKNTGGLFCLNDMMALGAIKALRDCKIKVGKEVFVVGFDNVLLGQYSVPALSTVDSFIDREAKQYVDYIIGEPSEQKEIISEFVPRDSAKA